MDSAKKQRAGTDGQFVLRFENGNQRNELKVRAAMNRRSMNAEILFLIEKGIEATSGATNTAQ